VIRKSVLSLVLWFLTASMVLADPAAKFRPAAAAGIPGEYLVVLADGVASDPMLPGSWGLPVAEVARRLAARYGGAVERSYEHALLGFAIRISEDAARRLAGDPAVRLVEQNAAVEPRTIDQCDPTFQNRVVEHRDPVSRGLASPETIDCHDPDPINRTGDPDPSDGIDCIDNWGLDLIDGARDDHYDFSATGQGVHVYLIDLGLDTGNAEFLDLGTSDPTDTRIKLGFNAAARDTDPESVKNDVRDCIANGHGTHVAAIVGGNTFGVAKRVFLHPVKFEDHCDGRNLTGSRNTIINAVDWIIRTHNHNPDQMGPAIVNFSGGNGSDTPMRDDVMAFWVSRLFAAGIGLVQSAGNQDDRDRVTAPVGPQNACLNTLKQHEQLRDGLIVAGGIDETVGPQGRRYHRWFRESADPSYPLCEPDTRHDCGSNSGLCADGVAGVDIWAPAAHIISAKVSGGACRLSGTSMAAPHVTGVAALLLERFSQASPSTIKKALVAVARSGVLDTSTLRNGPDRLLYSRFPTTGAPVAGDSWFTTPPGVALVIFKDELLRGDLDWNRDALQFSQIGFNDPTGGQLIDGGDRLTYLPNGGFTGVDSFSYTVSDGHGGSDTATVHIEVEEQPQPPVARNDCYETPAGTDLVLGDITEPTFLNNDFKGDFETYLVADPPHGQAGQLNHPSVTYIYRPDTGFTGTDTFSYFIWDIYRQKSQATITVHVGGGTCPVVNNPPTPQDDSFSTAFNTSRSFFASTLLANDTDPDGDAISFDGLVTLPANGYLSVDGVGPEDIIYRYNPNPGFIGVDSFVYQVRDARGGTATATVRFTVTTAGFGGNPDFFVTTVDGMLRVLASQLTSNDSPGAVFIRAENPRNGTLTIAGIGPEDIVYDFFPTPGFIGEAGFEYLISPNGNEPYTRINVTVQVNDGPPVAGFTTSCTGMACSFDASRSSDDVGIGSYAWSFGDGTTGSGMTASHTYTPGSYPVTLTVTDTAGLTASDDQVVTANALPVASFTFTCTGLTCSFDGSASTDDGGITAYAWNFGDGTSGSGVTASHTYATSGERTVTLTVTDTANQTNSTNRQVRIDLPPTACFTATRNGLTYTFDASCSSDEFGISTFSWNFGDGATGAGKIVSHTYATSGPRTVVLTVTDTGSQTATTSQSVNPDALPVANFTWSCTLRTCSFNGTSSTDNQPIASYSWNFGDGSTGSGSTVSHTYATSGNFQVTLTVTDTVGQTASTTKTVPIDLNPTACFTAVRDGLVYTFDASCSSDDLGISTYAWNFGDGTTGSGRNVSHTYATSGSRTVTLTVTDTGSHTATTSQTVNPDAKPVANFTWSCTQRTCTFNGTSSTDNQPIPTFTWNFGDGTTGSGANPTHVYAVGGPKPVILTVTDTVGQSNSKTQTVPVNRPPVANPDSATTNQNVAIDINVLANDSDLDSDPISVSTWTQPAHGSVAKNANGTMRYTPAAGYVGADSFTYQITDGKEPSGSATVSLTVVVPNKPPDAWDDGWYTYQNGPTNIPYANLLANDYDPNGDALTVTGINTAGLTGTLDCSFGTYCRFTPPSWFVGTTSFTYSANDGKGGTDPATVRIKVGVANGVPAPQDDILETAYNTALTFTRAALLLNDSDPNGDVLSVTAVYRAPLTALGTVSCSAANYVCTYTPPAGFTGVDVLTYQASDGVDIATARISILVRQPSPTVLDAREDQTFFTSAGGAFLSYTWMTSNDYDPEGGALTVVSVDTTGLLGTLDCTTFSTGCQYTRGTSDVTRFRYTVRDPQGNLDTTTVTLKPGNWSFNLNPVLANDQLATRMNTPLTFSIFDVLRNDYDPDNDQLTVSFYFASPHGQVICSTPAYLCTYTPSANFTGTDTLTYYAQDGNNSLSASVTVTVLPQIAKDALVLSQSVPVSMFAGQSYPVSVRLKNVGTTSWSLVGAQCSAFRLGSVNPYDNTTWGSSRAELPGTVAPGGEVTVSFNVTAPSTPGTYNFQRRMVHECVEWFGDLSPNVVVSVSP